MPGIPQDRIARRSSIPQKTLSDHLPKMAMMPNPVNADLSRCFVVSRVAENHGRTEDGLVTVHAYSKTTTDIEG